MCRRWRRPSTIPRSDSLGGARARGSGYHGARPLAHNHRQFRSSDGCRSWTGRVACCSESMRCLAKPAGSVPNVFPFIPSRREAYSVTRLCACYGVTLSSFYPWQLRSESAQQKHYRMCLRRGLPPSERTGPGGPQISRISDGDITYHSVAGWWRYLPVVMDQCSRNIETWVRMHTCDTRLTREVRDATARCRRPPRGLVFYSNRGSECDGQAFRNHMAALGLQHLMTRGGAPCESARMEKCYQSLKADLVHSRRIASADANRT
jgi:transposase InsO family protein